MPRKIVDTILPTTMVGSYPRPDWFNHQLLGRDVRVAFKDVAHEEAYNDATQAVIHDQEEAGLDIVTDGQMSYDDYVGVIGSFCWYMYERIGGFEPATRAASRPRSARRPEHKEVELLDDWGGVINSGPVTRGPIRLADLYKIAKRYADKPIKVSVGAGPVNLAWHVYFEHYKDPQELSYALAPIFNAEMKDLVEAGATYLQIEDLGAWLPLFTNDEKDYEWIARRDRQVLRRRRREDRLALLLRQRLGQRHPQRQLPAGLPDGAAVLLRHPGIDQFVLDYANRDMVGVDFLKNLPGRQGGRRSACSTSARSWSRRPSRSPTAIRKVIEYVPPERVTLTTDCGMKPLPRMVAKMKLKALADGAGIVREELE